MSTETQGFTPTDDDVARAAKHVADWAAIAVLATIGPIIERERRAAKAEGYWLAQQLAEDAVRLGEDHGLHDCPDCEDDFAAIRDAVRLPIANDIATGRRLADEINPTDSPATGDAV